MVIQILLMVALLAVYLYSGRRVYNAWANPNGSLSLSHRLIGTALFIFLAIATALYIGYELISSGALEAASQPHIGSGEGSGGGGGGSW